MFTLALTKSRFIGVHVMLSLRMCDVMRELSAGMSPASLLTIFERW